MTGGTGRSNKVSTGHPGHVLEIPLPFERREDVPMFALVIDIPGGDIRFDMALGARVRLSGNADGKSVPWMARRACPRTAIGIDPALIGAATAPGGALGAGSGSNIRESYWMLNSDMGSDRAVSLAPLYFIRDFNKWDPLIQFDYVMVDTSQTQDQHPTKTEKRIDQTQP